MVRLAIWRTVMRIMGRAIVALMVSASLASAASAAGWQSGPGPQIRLGEAKAPLYMLDCSGLELVVTQFGVTKLRDMQANALVSDTEGSTLPPGAALMALFTDKVDPNMVPASAVRNAKAGWDMTIRLRKDDRAFLSLPKAGMVSLFTTGFTTASMVDKADRKLFADFVKQCRSR
jgi:hypothetical protein